MNSTSMKTKKFIHYILSLITIIIGVLLIINNTPNPILRFDLYKDYAVFIRNGFFWTLAISLIVFAFSFIIGFGMFFTDRSKVPYVRYLTGHYTNFMFGSPMLVIVIVSYFFIGTSMGIENKPFLGTAGLTLYFAPFMMKLYISAYESLDKNQVIVCDLFGFNKWQTYRYVIFPQMIRIMLPPLSGYLATIIKSTSLLYIIGFQEMYYSLTTVQSKTFAYTEGYLMMMFLYLIITVPLIKLTGYLEKSIKI